VSDEAAVFVEPLACVVKALRRARLRRGDRLAVIGLGVMGLLHALLARVLGVERIVGVDRLPERLAGGTTAGANIVLDGRGPQVAEQIRQATDGGADVVVVTPASLGALQLGYASVAPGGRLILFAPLPPETVWPLSVHDLYFKEVEIIPSYSAGPDDTREALRRLEEGLPVEGLISHRLGLDRAAEGYRMVAEGRALKVVVKP
jgi:L-iditol 2-dehydrogenase